MGSNPCSFDNGVNDVSVKGEKKNNEQNPQVAEKLKIDERGREIW